jgi:glycosyltransferase involved in cell wall biosynthesis
MKLAILGGMVNSAYIMSKILQEGGIDVTFIRDPEDNFIPHQPIWVDQKIELESTQLYYKNIEDCFVFDKDYHWIPPNWYVNPLDNSFKGSLYPHSLLHISNLITRSLSKRRLERSKGWSQILSLLHGVDYILACGVSASIIARLSGKAYICWSYGADIRKIMGLENVHGSLADQLYDKVTIHLLKDAYRNAVAVGFNYGEKIYCAGGVHKLKKQLSLKNAKVIPFPAFYHTIKELNNSDITEQCEHKNIEDDRIIKILIPSRIDFQVKGHQKLIAALEKIDDLSNFQFTVTGWGKDQDEFIELIKSKSLQNNIVVKNTMLSRPLLHELIKSHDLIIDQFNLGIYGSAALEAMSFQKPVMMYVDSENSGHFEPPPIINGSTEQDILTALKKIKNKELNLKKIGSECYGWVKKYHSNDVFFNSLIGSFK